MMFVYGRTMDQSARDPLHGKTLESIVTELQTRLGWEVLAAEVPERFFS